ncbi:MAG: PH domain-containing protein [Chloroflexi bacterium]|nr:MAG: PH domain-containing protein [Chloroflexota bacterium]
MAPSGIILEPNEKVLLATRPLFLWEPLVILDIVFLILALLFTSTQPALMVVFLALFALLTLWLIVQWIPWSAKWYVLTDRRVITKRGVLNRTQAALLLDRVQDASISHPFPLAMIRDYGVLHLESAGEHAQERLEGGTHELAMTGSTKFYRALTDAQTPN